MCFSRFLFGISTLSSIRLRITTGGYCSGVRFCDEFVVSSLSPVISVRGFPAYAPVRNPAPLMGINDHLLDLSHRSGSFSRQIQPLFSSFSVWPHVWTRRNGQRRDSSPTREIRRSVIPTFFSLFFLINKKPRLVVRATTYHRFLGSSQNWFCNSSLAVSRIKSTK